MCGMCEAPEACMLCLVYSSQFEKLAQHTLEKPSSAQGYAARLESLRYRTHVPAVCTRTGLVHVLDLGRVFAAPREVQILPKYTPGPFCREAVSRLFPSAAQRTAFFLFVESTLNAICCTSRVLTTEFERAVLLRAPEITRAVCRAPSRERLERITALAVEVLEGAADVSKKEKESTYRALCMVVSRAPSPALRDDITAYLKKKLPCTVLSAYLAESAGLSPGPLLCGGRLSSTRLQRAIEHSKDLVYMLGSRAVGPCAYRPCIVEKAKCLKVLEELTPSEEFIVRCFFKAHNLCLASLQRSTELLFAPESVVGQYVARHYTPSLQRHTVPNTTSSTTSNSTTNSASNSTSSTTTNSASMSLECNMLLHFIEGTETALYPEKPFMYDLVSDVLQSMSSLTLLEVQGMHNLLEYTHAYSRVQYRRVEAAYKEFSVRHTAEKLSTKLRRHGPLRKTKSLLLLSKYQHEFFTKHYNYTLLDRVISDYFLRIIPLASTELLLFTARLPQTFHKILADVPCTSSADFLRVLGSFAYPALSSSAEPGQVFVYADIAGFFNADRKGHATKELSTLLEGSSDCPTPLHTYANRHADNGFLTRDTRASGDVSLPSVDALLHAAEKLSQWEATPGREEESRFLFSGFLAPSTPQFVNFLFGEKAHHRYTFVRSLKEGAEYRGEDETEEVLYVCTRKPEHLLSALERRKTLSSAGVCLAVSALEKKWLGMPAEMFFARSAPQHPLFHALGCTEEFLPLEASAEKCLVAAQLVIVKAEESLLLSQKETSWLFSLKQSLPSSLQSTYPALCSTLCKKAAAVHALRAVSEFEKKPLEILTDIVQPEMLGIEHAKENIHLVGALGKVCLTIFNRHRRHAQTLPGTKKRASSTDSDFVKKEEEAVKAVQTEKTRSVTEVEKLARVLGLQLFAQLASAESKIEHVISLLHLLFSSTEESKSPPSCPLEDIPVQHFLPLKEQILSKFFSLQMKKSESSVRVHLKRVIESMVQEAPYCVVYSILVREDRKWRTSFLSPALRSTAYAVMEEYKSILKQAHASIPPASRFPKDVPVLTHTPGKKEASGAQPCIAKVMMEYKVLKGVNKPVLVKILGTDGCVYKELIKKNDELKQDMLSTQVFEYMNTALSHTFGTRAIKQRVRTYKIVALEKFFGVIEFVSNTEPLGGVIERLYETHCPEGMSSKQCREILQGVRTCPVGKKVEALGSVLTHYRPVLKHVFCGRGPFEYFTQRKTFTASFALASIATYILGLGDRHPQNILLDLKTKEMVNIDLNLVFDQAQLLSIPETVPFRMTQNIQQCLFVHSRMGYEQHMESMLGVLKQKKENLLVFMGILQDEPLHRWQAIQKLTSSSKLFSDYTSILERLQDKLNGIEDGFALGSRAHVQCLVQKATDLSNLASIFPGWSPWM
ncbi:serine-protein kinase ATM [Nematocida sp. AWRm77]|nr:serine-protein kinase ATM [Nematocida sp. AWRm77]